MNNFDQFKKLLNGVWEGEGFAKFPTIDDTGYKEIWVFTPDETKDAVHYSQKTWYKNDTPKNGQTVFWDTGFILQKEENILLVSTQVGGRQETYHMVEFNENRMVFESDVISNDPKTLRSQRVIKIAGKLLDYELNMSTHQAAEFQNHLQAHLIKR
jgi:hypothetical protein